MLQNVNKIHANVPRGLESFEDTGIHRHRNNGAACRLKLYSLITKTNSGQEGVLFGPEQCQPCI